NEENDVARKSIQVSSAQVAAAKLEPKRANAKGLTVEPGISAIASARTVTGRSGNVGRKIG
ncbi:MAG: hypothetical protein M3Q39_08585, partial [Actinomycetota bacterium]|nr:hypothetical protein [Actinomycetota bacterium]